MDNLASHKSRLRLSRPVAGIGAFAAFVAISLALLLLIRSSASAADPASVIVDFDGGVADWAIEGYPAKALHDNTFVLTLTDEHGAPLTEASLRVKLEMIGMICGDYEFALTEAAPGVYTGQGMPLMAGLWKATATIESDHADTRNVKLTRTLKAVY